MSSRGSVAPSQSPLRFSKVSCMSDMVGCGRNSCIRPSSVEINRAQVCLLYFLNDQSSHRYFCANFMKFRLLYTRTLHRFHPSKPDCEQFIVGMHIYTSRKNIVSVCNPA